MFTRSKCRDATALFIKIGFIAVCFFLLSVSCGFPQTDFLQEINQLEKSGKFKQASELLTNALAELQGSLPEQKQLVFEQDRLERIKRDYPYTADQLFAEMSGSIQGLTRAEFNQWVEEGRFDSREIDGKHLFMSASISNLFFRYPDLEARRRPPRDNFSVENALLASCQSIRNAARATGSPYVLPKRFRATMTVTASPGAAPPGESIRAWLPIPRNYPFQKDFELISSSSAIKHIDTGESPVRSILLEQTAKKAEATEFQLVYDYTAEGVSFDVDPKMVKAAEPNDSQLAPFLAEEPHVVFTPEILGLAKKLSAGETNPYLKARKFYDWIAQNIKYSYAIEYSTIRNISDYTRTKCYGDCGQEALLFITLCRASGIPARFQSGWNTFPGAKTIHDWSEIYVAPYGWMPVDPYMGIYATQYVRTLDAEQKRTLRDFYFGGLDQFRMIANSGHKQVLNPPKRSMRSDDVDFQRGELEYGDHNIYFNKYKYRLDVRELESKKLD